MNRWLRLLPALSGACIGIGLGQWLGHHHPWFALLLIPGSIGTIPIVLDTRSWIRYKRGVEVTEGKHRKHHRFTRWVLRHLEHRVLVTIYHRIVPFPWRVLTWLVEHVFKHEVRKHRKEGKV